MYDTPAWYCRADGKKPVMAGGLFDTRSLMLSCVTKAINLV